MIFKNRARSFLAIAVIVLLNGSAAQAAPMDIYDCIMSGHIGCAALPEVPADEDVVGRSPWGGFQGSIHTGR